MTSLLVTPHQLDPRFRDESAAQGEDAHRIRMALQDIHRLLDQAQTRGGARSLLRKDVIDILSTTNRRGWDGYEAIPIVPATVAKTLLFIDILPLDMPTPDVTPEPDGEIALEWYKSPSWVLSISVGQHNRLAYAGLFGPSKTYGAEEWHTAVPRMVTEAMRRFMAEDTAPQ